MPNRSQEENLQLLLEALRTAGPAGLTVDEARVVLSGGGEQSKSTTKKLLEQLRNKSHVQTKMGRSGPRFYIIQGH